MFTSCLPFETQSAFHLSSYHYTEMGSKCVNHEMIFGFHFVNFAVKDRKTIPLARNNIPLRSERCYPEQICGWPLGDLFLQLYTKQSICSPVFAASCYNWRFAGHTHHRNVTKSRCVSEGEANIWLKVLSPPWDQYRWLLVTSQSDDFQNILPQKAGKEVKDRSPPLLMLSVKYLCGRLPSHWSR